MTYLAWLIFIVAALLEVGGDAVIRKGLALSNWTFIASGFLMLGCSAWWLIWSSGTSRSYWAFMLLSLLWSVFCGDALFSRRRFLSQLG